MPLFGQIPSSTEARDPSRDHYLGSRLRQTPSQTGPWSWGLCRWSRFLSFPLCQTPSQTADPGSWGRSSRWVPLRQTPSQTIPGSWGRICLCFPLGQTPSLMLVFRQNHRNFLRPASLKKCSNNLMLWLCFVFGKCETSVKPSCFHQQFDFLFPRFSDRDISSIPCNTSFNA